MKGFYRLFVLITALSCCLNLASAQNAAEWMPDANLRTAVRQALNIAADSSLTQQAMQALTILNAESSEITDIKGLEQATELEVLNLGTNKITTITPLEGLTHLTELSLNANPIRDITGLKTLVNLTRLNLGSNQIINITPLRELIQITDLNLLNNSITDIAPLAELKSLIRLTLSENQISDLTPLRGLAQISSLSLSENHITDLAPISNLAGITSLDLFGNQISDLTPIADLTQITYLNLSENQIRDIAALKRLKQLIRLEISGNQVQNVAPLKELTEITHLDLSANEIRDITDLEDLTRLRRLYLNTNRITDAAPLSNLDNLEVLWVSGNPIGDLMPFRRLRRLNPDITIDIEFHQLVAATGITLAVEKPSGLSSDRFTIRPGEFVLLVRTRQSSVNEAGDFKTYRSYYSVDQKATNADFPNLAHLFQNGGRIELITDTHQNPLSSETNQPEFGDLVISEIMWGLDRASTNKQWIELYNASGHTYTFTDGSLSLRFSDTSANPLPNTVFTPSYDANRQAKVIDRMSNIRYSTNRKGWNPPGQSGDTSQNRPLVSMYRVINYTTGIISDGTLPDNWRASSGRVNFNLPNHGTPGAEHLPPSPTVLIDVSERPPLFWVNASTGTLHRLTGNRVEQIFPTVQNATSLSVDTANGKIYWTEKISNARGKIQRANMDGSNLEVVKRLTGVIKSMAIDTRRGKIYVANNWGRIQRLNLDGSNFQPNFITSSNSPDNITVDTENRKIYWSDGTNLKRANLNGSNPQNILKGSGTFTGVAIAGAQVYWTEMLNLTVSANRGKIRRANLNGSNVETLITTNNTAAPLGIAVNFASRKLYWADSAGKVRRADLNGSDIEGVITGLETPEGFSAGALPTLIYTETGTVLGSPAIYWADRQTAAIRRVNINNLKVENVITDVPDSSAIALDLTRGQIYWTETDTGKIRRANLNGSNVQDLIIGLTGPLSIALDLVRGKMYWTNQDWDSFTGTVTASTIQRADLNGSNVQDIATGLGTVAGIALDTAMGKVYWTDSETGTIQRANLNGSNVEDLVDGTRSPSGIALDTAGGKMYWADYEGKEISRANLNGSNVQPLVTGLAGPSNIILDAARRKIYWMDQVWNPATGSITESSIQRVNLDGSNVQAIFTGLGEAAGMALGPSQTFTGTSVTRSASDINADGKVNNTDLLLVAAALGQNTPVNSRVDVNGDGTVNAADLMVVISDLDTPVNPGAPEIGSHLTAVDRARIQAEIRSLQLVDDGSLKYRQVLAFLQSLLASATPQETRLLANYPNPFNPETWIPYQLAIGTDVQILIYDAKGTLIRQLGLGYQPEGYYTDRNSAAYWNGRNALGEHVASGIYFYQLRTNEASTLRKMLLLK